MYLWVGSIPTAPNIYIASITTIASAFITGIIREQAKFVFDKVKEWMPMLVISLVALLGTAGVLGKQGCHSMQPAEQHQS
jgi:hypothetical protein